MKTAKAPLELLTKAELLGLLRISLQTLNRMIKGREIPFVKLGRRVLFRREDVDRLIRSRLVK